MSMRRVMTAYRFALWLGFRGGLCRRLEVGLRRCLRVRFCIGLAGRLRRLGCGLREGGFDVLLEGIEWDEARNHLRSDDERRSLANAAPHTLLQVGLDAWVVLLRVEAVLPLGHVDARLGREL